MEAWLKQAKAMRNYHLHHPFDDSPAALPWPTDPPKTVCKLADLRRNRAKATMQTLAEPPLRDSGQQATHPFFQPHAPPAQPPPVPPKRARRERGAPAPSPQQARKDSRATTSKLPAPPPDPPDQLGVRPPPARSILIIIPAATSTARAQGVPRVQKGTKVQQPFRNDHTGDWMWCDGTIQYRLQKLGRNGGVEIRVTWHRQKELDQGNSNPDKRLGDTLELNSAHAIGLFTPENKAHRGTKYTEELPPEWSQGLPPPRLPKRPPAGKKSLGPNPPP